MPSEDEKFSALAAHYNDTFGLIRAYLKQRDRYFAAALAVVMVMLLQIAAPESSDRLISVIIGKEIVEGAAIDRTLVGTIVWLLLLASAFRYFQLVVLVNRQYKYIHLVENALSSEYDGVLFTREGRWYLDRYPGFSNWTHFVYRVVFPMLMLAVSTAKIWSDVAQVWPGWGGCCLSVYLVLNVAIFLVVVVSLLLYVRIFEVSRQLRLAVVTIRAVLTKRRVDEAVRAEERVVGALDRTDVGTTATADSGSDER